MSLALDVNDSIRPYTGDHRRPAHLGYLAIAVAFGGFGVWAALAPLDSATVATGQVAIESDRKPIQHLEGGIVREILVHETEHVAAGQVLFRLEPVQARASLDALRKQLDLFEAQEARLDAEREARTEMLTPVSLEARAIDPNVAAVIADQRRQFAEHRRSADNDVNLQDVRIAQANRDISGKQSQGALLQQQLESYQAELKGIAELVKKGYYPRNKMNITDRERLRIKAELEGIETDIVRAQGSREEAQVQLRQIRQRYVEDATSQLADVRGKMAEAREKLTVATDVLARSDVRAPRAGIIQDIKVHTVGAVLRGGDAIADLVTLADGLVVTAKVLPNDIQNVVTGQRTEVRFPTLAHLQKRPAFGQLASISADLITDDKAAQSYYAARVVMDPAALDPDVAARLVPGMPADLLIVNGERTVLDYIVEPIRTRFAKSMREK